jgi:ankyrin repeat protein
MLRFLQSIIAKLQIRRAVKSGNILEVRRILSKHPELIASKDHDGWTLLHLAVNSNQPDVVGLLLDSGIDADAKDKIGETAFYLAVWSGFSGVAAKLLPYTRDTDLNVAGKSTTPLHAFALIGDTSMVEFLLKNGANPDLLDTDGKTALHNIALMAMETSECLIKSLLAHGASVNAKSKEGETPLHFAIMRCSLDGIMALLLAGANLETKDDTGNTPFDVAMKVGRTDVLNLLHSWKDTHFNMNLPG